MRRWYPFRKWLRTAAGQHPGVPGSGKPGWCWGDGAEPGALAPSLPGWGTGEDPSREGLGDGEGGERESRGTLVCQRAGCTRAWAGTAGRVRISPNLCVATGRRPGPLVPRSRRTAGLGTSLKTSFGDPPRPPGPTLGLARPFPSFGQLGKLQSFGFSLTFLALI